MRWGLIALTVSAALALAAPALATRSVAVGDVSGDTSPRNSITFDISGKVNGKGKFIPRQLSGFRVTVDFNCFDGAGNLLSTSKRSDLAFSLIAPTKVKKKGRFATGYATSITSMYAISGHIRHGKATGILSAVEAEGDFGPHPRCSSGTFANPNVAWSAKLIRPVCDGGSGQALPYCAAPRP